MPSLSEAVEAFRDWRSNWRHYLGIRSKWLQPNLRGAGVTRFDPQKAQPGLTFLTAYRDGRFGAYLIDMEGRIRHRWTVDPESVWRAAGYAQAPMPDVDVSIHGARLLTDGSAILNLAGAALVKLDRCSNIRWATAAGFHHSVETLADGGLIVPGRVERREPLPELPYVKPARTGSFKEDTLVFLDGDGRLERQVSLLSILARSDAHALLSAGPGSGWEIRDRDPLHLNEIEPLPEALAAAFPMFRAGDLLISMRNLNTIAVLDGSSLRLKWWKTGPFFGQHDPEFLPNGHIAVFDNRIRGLHHGLGYSRLLEIDPLTGRITWQYRGTDADPFYSYIGGKIQWLENGDLLVAEPQGGRVFEITRTQPPRIVWEYVNEVEPGTVGMVFDALRYPQAQLSFLGRPCARSASVENSG